MHKNAKLNSQGTVRAQQSIRIIVIAESVINTGSGRQGWSDQVPQQVKSSVVSIIVDGVN